MVLAPPPRNGAMGALRHEGERGARTGDARGTKEAVMPSRVGDFQIALERAPEIARRIGVIYGWYVLSAGAEERTEGERTRRDRDDPPLRR